MKRKPTKGKNRLELSMSDPFHSNKFLMPTTLSDCVCIKRQQFQGYSAECAELLIPESSIGSTDAVGSHELSGPTAFGLPRRKPAPVVLYRGCRGARWNDGRRSFSTRERLVAYTKKTQKEALFRSPGNVLRTLYRTVSSRFLFGL
jgi:hypothetical protein